MDWFGYCELDVWLLDIYWELHLELLSVCWMWVVQSVEQKAANLVVTLVCNWVFQKAVQKVASKVVSKVELMADNSVVQMVE